MFITYLKTSITNFFQTLHNDDNYTYQNDNSLLKEEMSSENHLDHHVSHAVDSPNLFKIVDDDKLKLKDTIEEHKFNSSTRDLRGTFRFILNDPGATRGHPGSPGATRGHQGPPGVTRGHPGATQGHP